MSQFQRFISQDFYLSRDFPSDGSAGPFTGYGAQEEQLYNAYMAARRVDNFDADKYRKAGEAYFKFQQDYRTDPNSSIPLVLSQEQQIFESWKQANPQSLNPEPLTETTRAHSVIYDQLPPTSMNRFEFQKIITGLQGVGDTKSGEVNNAAQRFENANKKGNEKYADLGAIPLRGVADFAKEYQKQNIDKDKKQQDFPLNIITDRKNAPMLKLASEDPKLAAAAIEAFKERGGEKGLNAYKAADIGKGIELAMTAANNVVGEDSKKQAIKNVRNLLIDNKFDQKKVKAIEDGVKGTIPQKTQFAEKMRQNLGLFGKAGDDYAINLHPIDSWKNTKETAKKIKTNNPFKSLYNIVKLVAYEIPKLAVSLVVATPIAAIRAGVQTVKENKNQRLAKAAENCSKYPKVAAAVRNALGAGGKKKVTNKELNKVMAALGKKAQVLENSTLSKETITNALNSKASATHHLSNDTKKDYVVKQEKEKQIRKLVDDAPELKKLDKNAKAEIVAKLMDLHKPDNSPDPKKNQAAHHSLNFALKNETLVSRLVNESVKVHSAVTRDQNLNKKVEQQFKDTSKLTNLEQVAQGKSSVVLDDLYKLADRSKKPEVSQEVDSQLRQSFKSEQTKLEEKRQAWEKAYSKGEDTINYEKDYIKQQQVLDKAGKEYFKEKIKTAVPEEAEKMANNIAGYKQAIANADKRIGELSPDQVPKTGQTTTRARGV